MKTNHSLMNLDYGKSYMIYPTIPSLSQRWSKFWTYLAPREHVRDKSFDVHSTGLQIDRQLYPRSATYPEPAESMTTLELRVGGLDTGTDLIGLFKLHRILSLLSLGDNPILSGCSQLGLTALPSLGRRAGLVPSDLLLHDRTLGG